MALNDVVDRGALQRGVLWAAGIAVPAGIASQLFVDDDGDVTAWSSLFAVVVLAGLAVGAAVAARHQRTGTPLIHGITTALGVLVAVQLIGLVRRAIAGDEITWSRVASNVLLAVMAGTLGGLIGSFLAGARSCRQDRSSP